MSNTRELENHEGSNSHDVDIQYTLSDYFFELCWRIGAHRLSLGKQHYEPYKLSSSSAFAHHHAHDSRRLIKSATDFIPEIFY